MCTTVTRSFFFRLFMVRLGGYCPSYQPVAGVSCHSSGLLLRSPAVTKKKGIKPDNRCHHEREEGRLATIFCLARAPSEWRGTKLRKHRLLSPEAVRHRWRRNGEHLRVCSQCIATRAVGSSWPSTTTTTVPQLQPSGGQGRAQQSVVGRRSSPGSDCEEIRRLCEQGRLEEAVTALEALGTRVPTVHMYSSLLKACARRKALNHAKRVHSHLTRHGLDCTRFLGEYMVSTLVKCGALHDAHQLFHKLERKTVFSWTALISGLTSAGRSREAIGMYHGMREAGLQPNRYTLCSLLRACGSLPDLDEGRRVHAEAAKHKLEWDLFVSTCLVDMYAKCGSVVDAERVFNALPQPDVVSCNSMLAAYVEQGRAREALRFYDRMRGERQDAAAGLNDRTFVVALQACGMLAEKADRAEALQKGKEIHEDARSKGCEADAFVGSTLISMYGKCGSIVDAVQVFQGLAHKNVVTWNAMLAAYVQHGQPEKALQLYEEMSSGADDDGGGGVRADNRTFVSVLQACGMVAETEEEVVVDGRTVRVKSLEAGSRVHGDARSKGYDGDVFVGNTLVSMYGKCGDVVHAQAVFDGLAQKSVVSWTALLAAYAQQGEGGKVVQLYEQMQKEGVAPNNRTFVIAIQACGMLADKEDACVEVVEGGGLGDDDAPPPPAAVKVKALEQGRAIHADAKEKGHGAGVFVGNTLISMYGKCGSIRDAEQVFDELSAHRDVVSWTVMVSSYVLQGEAEKALHLYERMRKEEEGGQKKMSPDERTIVGALQACGMMAEKECEQQQRRGGGGGVDGQQQQQQQQQMVKARALDKAAMVHCDVRRKGFERDVFVGSTLVSVYGKCGSVVDARKAFDKLPRHSAVPWNAMLAAYVQVGQPSEALRLYGQMQGEGRAPDARTFVRLLQACGMLAAAAADGGAVGGPSPVLERGRALHEEARRRGLDPDVYVGSTLISMYGKCGAVAAAEAVFAGGPPAQRRNVVCWTALLLMYAEQGHAEKALRVYEEMQEQGVRPNDRTLVGALQACGTLAGAQDAEEEDEEVGGGVGVKAAALRRGRAVHADARRTGYGANVFVGSSLISMYGKCGSLADARAVFDRLPRRDVVAWTVMLAVYAQHGQAEVAVQLYERMLGSGVAPDEVALVCILQACSRTGGLHMCRRVHQSFVSGSGSGGGGHLSLLLSTTLVHAYGRCASMADARAVFDALVPAHQPDAVAWNALMAGYAREGDWAATLRCYHEMLQPAATTAATTKPKPDRVTFLAVLCACSHAGLVGAGVDHLASMARDHGVPPDIEHYVSVVDMLARAGLFDDVERLVSSMPVAPDLAVWLCLLGACRKHGGQVSLARRAFQAAVAAQPRHSSTYALMFHVYADAGMWEAAREVRALGQAAGAWKKVPGRSWVEVDGKVHAFVVEDREHAQWEQVYGVVDMLAVQLQQLEQQEQQLFQLEVQPGGGVFSHQEETHHESQSSLFGWPRPTKQLQS